MARPYAMPTSFYDHRGDVNWSSVYLAKYGEPPSVFIDLVREVKGLPRMITLVHERRCRRERGEED